MGFPLHYLVKNATGCIVSQVTIHYEIPFERVYTVLFPLSYSVNTATGYID